MKNANKFHAVPNQNLESISDFLREYEALTNGLDLSGQ
jgi:hypothetical protein